MGWQVKIKTENEVTKYRIWTTISDGWITKWMTKAEITKFFFWHRFREFMDKLIEDEMTFPNRYTNKDTGCIIYDKKVTDAFRKFQNDCIEQDDSKAHDKMACEKFSEILNAHGITMMIKDVEGFGFNSIDEEIEEEKK